MIHVSASNDCPNGVAIGPCIGRAFEDCSADSLSTNVTPTSCIEGTAATISRKHTEIRHCDEDIGIEMKGRADNDRLLSAKSQTLENYAWTLAGLRARVTYQIALVAFQRLISHVEAD